MLIAGMDISGGEDSGEQKYIAIIIGQENSIDQLSSKIGSTQVHMANLPPNVKTRIVESIQTKQDNILAFCIIMDKKRIVDSIYALRKIRRKNYPISKIRSVFERALFQLIKSKIEEFCFNNGESVTNVRFECESDCRPFARANSLSVDEPKEAHRISDIIAWCNHRGQRIQWVNDLDLAEQIPVSMKKLLKLN